MSSNVSPEATTVVETGCCPRFDPVPWHDRIVTWDSKMFVRDRVRSVLHIPLNFGSVVSRNIEAIGDSLDPSGLTLCDENSIWGTDVFLAVTRPIPGLEMTVISGTFLATVREGTFRQLPEFSKSAVAAAKRKGISPDQLYFWYTTCPKCAKAYGENYIVIFVGPSRPV